MCDSDRTHLYTLEYAMDGLLYEIKGHEASSQYVFTSTHGNFLSDTQCHLELGSGVALRMPSLCLGQI